MNELTLQFRHTFARLVGLLVHRPQAIDEQKQALRAVIVTTNAAAQRIVLAELNHALVDAVRLSPPPVELPFVTLLAARMAEHSASALDFEERARPADVLGIARALAAPPVIGDDGAHFDALVVAVAATTVSATIGRGRFTRNVDKDGAAAPVRVPTPGVPMRGLGIEGDHYRQFTSPRIPTPVALAIVPRDDLSPAAQDPAKALLEASFTRGHGEIGLDEMYERLMKATEVSQATRAADDLVRTAEQKARDGLWLDVMDIFGRLLDEEGKHSDPEMRRAILIHVRRLSTPANLRGLAQLLPRRREVREPVHRLLVWAGDVGADVLIDLMTTAEKSIDRRAYRAALVECPSAVAPLTQMLDDDRWFVVRNAVEILGEMEAKESDARIVPVLKHSDARVRRSAATTMARLATARSLAALVPMLSDAESGVRLAAVHGIGSLRSPRATSAILAVIEGEEEPDVLAAMYAALAAAPTDPAVARLKQAAQPGSLFSRRSAAARLPAIQALADAGTPAALSALRGLVSDRDRDVRDAVAKCLSAGRRTTAGN